MYLTEYLRNHRVWFKRLPHAPASSAERLAARLHIPGREVAKAVLVRAGDEDRLAVLPATSRIDLTRLAEALDHDPAEIRLATFDEILQRFPNCEPGAIPPFGRLYKISTILDESLIQPEIAFSGHTRHEALRMRLTDYEIVEAPLHARFAIPIRTPSTPAATSRLRAG